MRASRSEVCVCVSQKESERVWGRTNQTWEGHTHTHTHIKPVKERPCARRAAKCMCVCVCVREKEIMWERTNQTCEGAPLRASSSEARSSASLAVIYTCRHLDAFKCVTWLINMCAMTHSYVCNHSFIWVTRLIYIVPWLNESPQQCFIGSHIHF